MFLAHLASSILPILDYYDIIVSTQYSRSESKTPNPPYSVHLIRFILLSIRATNIRITDMSRPTGTKVVTGVSTMCLYTSVGQSRWWCPIWERHIFPSVILEAFLSSPKIARRMIHNNNVRLSLSLGWMVCGAFQSQLIN